MDWHEYEKASRKIRNLKSRIRRRMKKLNTIYDPLERGRRKDEIETLRGEQLKLETKQAEQCFSFLERLVDIVDPPDKTDWSNAGKA